ncbi:hypothetical protein [Amycolatopsis sp. SID8362]|uniref:hypothetical protein n=1 Tax=Amycolatopsis sp. SID8362 TaxID=2690346 RepID=UPI001368BD0B|nr:hypothetical protein [Amycolatopsis sp. SID8362]NBH07481.1 hypothetical protein [Amycolatopsis sp. SID8362]NED44177.1 hypothetical protein [Amycolatopsis sp. SID8362]
MTTAIPFLVLALLLVALGRWGGRHAGQLVPAALPGAERERRTRVLRRGAVTAYVVAAVFVAMSVVAVF